MCLSLGVCVGAGTLGGRWELLVWEQMKKNKDRALLTASMNLLHAFQVSQQAWALRCCPHVSDKEPESETAAYLAAKSRFSQTPLLRACGDTYMA